MLHEAADAPLRVVGDDDEPRRGRDQRLVGLGLEQVRRREARRRSVIPCTPMNSRSTWSDRERRSRRPGRRARPTACARPPVSTTVRSGGRSRVQHVGDLERVGDDREVRRTSRCGARAARSSCRRRARSPGPARTRPAAVLRDRLLLGAAARCDLASNPGSSARAAASRVVAPPCTFSIRPGLGERVEVAADGHLRDAELLGQLADADRAAPAHFLDDDHLPRRPQAFEDRTLTDRFEQCYSRSNFDGRCGVWLDKCTQKHEKARDLLVRSDCSTAPGRQAGFDFVRL